MINSNFREPSIRFLNTDNYGNTISILQQNELKQVINSTIVLSSLPDRQHRITISDFVEISLTDKIESTDQFKCDYSNGVLYFHPSKEGQYINIDKYYSIGYFLIHASRVYLKDKAGEIITLEQKLSELEEKTNT